MAGDFAQVLEERVAALKRAATGASLSRLLEEELGDQGRYTLDGPDVVLHPDWAFALSLLLHELATNARSHGSLSSPLGCVEVDWHIDDSDLVLCWRESGGAPARRPPSPGFGQLLVAYAAVKLQGSASMLYLEAGLRCDVRISLLASWPQRCRGIFLQGGERHALPARAM